MINYQIDTEGIATLSWDMPGRSQNVINGQSLAALATAIERALADPQATAILMTSSKSDFIAGGDLDWLLDSCDLAQIYSRAETLHRLLRRLECGGKPVAMAIPGSALGGGLEVALAGHYRVAGISPGARFGLPEVTLGLLPGAGGTQRLPRLIGVQRALPLMLEGKRLRTAEALELGILDAAVDPGTEVDAARTWLLGDGRRSIQQPWDVKGYRIPGGAISSPQMQQFLVGVNARIRATTRGNQAAPAAIASCVYEGLITDIDTGLKTESRYFAMLVNSPQAKAMIRTLFFSLGKARALTARPAGHAHRSFTKVGIMGAGMMGAGIAYVTAKAGINVVLIDATRDLAERGKDYSRRLVHKQLERGQIDSVTAEALLDRIEPTADHARLRGADMVIEAVFEDRRLKAEVIQRCEGVLAADAIVASNTSTLPISGLAESSSRPGNFIGLHFFSPVDRMPLIEVIVGKHTSSRTLAEALDFVQFLGMTPIVVKDSRGFYTSRVFATYVREGLAMLEEGVAPALIESAGLQSGMPVGPLALTDEVSSELIHRIEQQTREDLGAAYTERPGVAVAGRMVELGRIGRKAGAGFYDYPASGRKTLWPGLAELYPRAEQPAFDALIDRLITVQAVEAVRCLDEGVLSSAGDADVGAILGWGFPAFRGGPISHIQGVGAARFVALVDALAAQHGERFAAPPLLREMARRGTDFFPR
ncbi:fatty acid oxidation complex subunit alpha [mine drainage metagenome]|jgi:3-hydroxyacyl-CoA dehydrogenase/enoyl-CoA hydratase/3-hydroxybutyryl-CoA epimerase|uniref:Fatty acid oxidation complex subunit alpha n=1 Tax=mine drainage metagenome TaxID=410659 RepID=A0A1J5RCB8_9ZZZZ